MKTEFKIYTSTDSITPDLLTFTGGENFKITCNDCNSYKSTRLLLVKFSDKTKIDLIFKCLKCMTREKIRLFFKKEEENG